MLKKHLGYKQIEKIWNIVRVRVYNFFKHAVLRIDKMGKNLMMIEIYGVSKDQVVKS